MQGLALINGTQLITALGAEAVHRAENIARQADVVAALTLQAMEGTPVAYDKGQGNEEWAGSLMCMYFLLQISMSIDHTRDRMRWLNG